MHDTAGLEARGVPTVFIATVEFTDGAEHQARALGVDTAAVYVPHPIQDRSDRELIELADNAAQEILDQIRDRGE